MRRPETANLDRFSPFKWNLEAYDCIYKTLAFDKDINEKRGRWMLNKIIIHKNRQNSVFLQIYNQTR